MSRAGDDEEAGWLLLWNVGILVGLVGLPALLGFFAGRSIDVAQASRFPFRFVFLALGAIVGALAAWRTLVPKKARSGD
jgi:hypothetical protein